MQRLIVILLLAWGGAACATITHGAMQKVSVVTDPPGARARIGTVSCTTPGTLELSRGAPGEVTITKPGYKTQRVELKRELTPVVWANLLCGALGFIVDVGNGAAYDLKPGDIHLQMIAGNDEPSPNPATQVAVARQPAKETVQVAVAHEVPAPPPPPPAPTRLKKNAGLVAILPLNLSRAKIDDGSKFALEEGIRTSLGEALLPYGYTLLTGETTLAILSDNGIDPGKACEASCALQAARELKADLFVSGAFVSAEDSLLAFVKVFEAKSGKQLGALQLEGRTAKEIRQKLAAQSKALVDEAMQNSASLNTNG